MGPQLAVHRAQITQMRFVYHDMRMFMVFQLQPQQAPAGKGGKTSQTDAEGGLLVVDIGGKRRAQGQTVGIESRHSHVHMAYQGDAVMHIAFQTRGACRVLVVDSQRWLHTGHAGSLLSLV